MLLGRKNHKTEFIHLRRISSCQSNVNRGTLECYNQRIEVRPGSLLSFNSPFLLFGTLLSFRGHLQKGPGV